MKYRLLILILFFFLLGCSDNSDSHVSSVQRKFGLYIENGARQGFQEYNYRCNTITLTNDTTIPVRLEIGFLEEDLNDIIPAKLFLLPRHLTLNQQHFGQSMSEELKRFLDFEIDKNERLNKLLNPKEKCVLIFGILMDIKYADPTTPYGTEFLTSQENTSTISCKLKINDTLIIPCGHITFIEK